MEQATFWRDADETRAPKHLRDLALDVLEWVQAFGHGPVSLERWAAEFRPGMSFQRNERQWLKLRDRWARRGVGFELIEEEHPGQAKKVLARLTPAAVAWADEVLERGRNGAEDVVALVEEAAEGIETAEREWGPRAVSVAAQADRYRRSASEFAAGADPDPLLVHELLSVAAHAEGPMVPIHVVARDLWLIELRHVGRLALAAGLRIHHERTQRWFLTEEAAEVLDERIRGQA
tara:strand:- start:30813 stop:31514 length:702 start_codon:yes stop_codon:yes gene_type:complete